MAASFPLLFLSILRRIGAEMAPVSLKKLISGKQLSAVINGIMNVIGPPICIQDAEGRLLFGRTVENPAGRYPIKLSEDILGYVIGHESSAPLAGLLTYFVNQEFEKKALISETLRLYKDITLLYNISEKMSSCMDFRGIARLVIDEIKSFIRPTAASVMLMDGKTGLLEIIAALGREYDMKTTLQPGEGIAGCIFLAGKSEIVNDVLSDPRHVEGFKKVSSMMCAPLRVNEKVIGVINVSSEQPFVFTAEHLKHLNTIALPAAATLKNAMLVSDLEDLFIGTVKSLASAVDAKSPWTAGHSERVTRYALEIGKKMELHGEEVRELELAGLLHDIGKIGTNEAILDKPCKLNPEETEIVKMHPGKGAELLDNIKQLGRIIPVVRHHHEKYDGTGYPGGLKGEEIPLSSRILSVVDAYDAMKADRPYRKGMAGDLIIEEIKRCSGTQFDPYVVEIFLAVYRDMKILL